MLVVVGVISVLHGALVALAQSDFKRMIAYTSVNHMGYIVLAVGAAAATAEGSVQARSLAVTGSVTQMVSHGLTTGALFLLAGVLYERGRTYDMSACSGVAASAPALAAMTGVAAFASLRLSGFSGFIAEFQIFTGRLGPRPLATALAVLGIMLTAGCSCGRCGRSSWGRCGCPTPRELRVRSPTSAHMRVPPSFHCWYWPWSSEWHRASCWTSSSRRPGPYWSCSPDDGHAMTDMNENPLDILPEVLLAASAVLGLLLGAWQPRGRQWMVGGLAAVACTGGITAAGVAAASGRPLTAFGEAFAVDPVTSTSRIVILGVTLLVLALSAGPLHAHPRESEFYVLLQLAALGALVMAGAQDLLLIAAGYLLASIPAYTLAGFRKDGPGTKAALKYYVIGALLGVLMADRHHRPVRDRAIHRLPGTRPRPARRARGPRRRRNHRAHRRCPVQGRCCARPLLGSGRRPGQQPSGRRAPHHAAEDRRPGGAAASRRHRPVR